MREKEVSGHGTKPILHIYSLRGIYITTLRKQQKPSSPFSNLKSGNPEFETQEHFQGNVFMNRFTVQTAYDVAKTVLQFAYN